MSDTSHDAIDLRSIFNKVVRKWWLFLIVTVVAVGVAAAYVKTTAKEYAVTGVMLMSDSKRNSFGGNNEEFLKGSSYLMGSNGLEDQISVLMSYTNMLNTVRQLDFGISYYEEKDLLRHEIYENKPFTVRLDTGLQITGVFIRVTPDLAKGTYRVRAEGKYVRMFNAATQKSVDNFIKSVDLDKTVKIGEPFRSRYLNFHIEFSPKSTYGDDVEYSFIPFSWEDVASYYRGKTTAAPKSDDSNIITITTTGEDVQKEIDFVNTLMQTYIIGEQDRHNQKGKSTIAFIDRQLDRSTLDLQTAEGNLQNVQTSAGGLVGSAGDRGAAVFNDLSRLKDELGRAESKLEYLGELIVHMGKDDGGTPSTISAANVDSPALNSLIDQYNQDVNELASRHITERQQSAPTIALARKVLTERNQIIQSAQDARRGAQLERDQITERVKQLEYQLKQLPQSSREVSIATRKYDLNASINTYLMEKRYEAEIAVASDQVDKTIVDPARANVGGPISPSKRNALILALLVGLVLPFLVILVQDFFNDKVTDLDQLKGLSPIPVLSSIPTSKRKRILSGEDRNNLGESFRTARINLQYLNPNMLRQVIGITSSTSGEGKTFCAVNLATVMAMSNKRTLLMDADMRKPMVQTSLDLPDGKGLSTYLIGEAGVDEIIGRTDIKGLDVIIAGPIPPNPLELAESPRMGELLQQLRTRYDQIIIDASPMGIVSEFKVLVHHLDITLYVVRQGYTKRVMLRPLNDLYRSGKMQHVDLLLNDVKAGEGYGYVYDA
jgi:capsular exopolysaccharide synthesis family protein